MKSKIYRDTLSHYSGLEIRKHMTTEYMIKKIRLNNPEIMLPEI